MLDLLVNPADICCRRFAVATLSSPYAWLRSSCDKSDRCPPVTMTQSESIERASLLLLGSDWSRALLSSVMHLLILLLFPALSETMVQEIFTWATVLKETQFDLVGLKKAFRDHTTAVLLLLLSEAHIACN